MSRLDEANALLAEWVKAQRSGFDMAAWGVLRDRTLEHLHPLPLIGDVQFTETDRVLAKLAREKLAPTEALEESLARLVAWAPHGEQCCGCGVGGSVDEPPQCCADPINPQELLRKVQAAVATLRWLAGSAAGMSQTRIDVLAVMDRHVEAAEGQLPFGRDSFEALRLSRAAVAELIEAADGVRGAARISDWRRLEAALAAVRP